MKILFKIFYFIFGFVFLGLLFMLLGNIFPIWGYQTMIVTSGSMEPAIKTGSAVVVHGVDEYKIGDVITFHERGKDEFPTTHRIVADQIVSDEIAFVTKGDANKDPDEQPVMKSKIIGKVKGVVPGVGYLLSMAKTRLGFVVLVGLPFVLVVIEEIRKIRKTIMSQKSS